MATMMHPNIVRLYGVMTQGMCCHMVHESSSLV